MEKVFLFNKDVDSTLLKYHRFIIRVDACRKLEEKGLSVLDGARTHITVLVKNTSYDAELWRNNEAAIKNTYLSFSNDSALQRLLDDIFCYSKSENDQDKLEPSETFDLYYLGDHKFEIICHTYSDIESELTTETEDKKEDIYLSRNKIWFGAPGTGKSYNLNEETKNFLGEEFETNHERVTFHPDYSYANFVGTYKPIMTKVEGKDNISYKYVPGPFMRVLVKALNNPEQNFVLVIEEINRANTAAVFGDIFQLLDRNSDGDSEYPIAISEDIKSYLKQELGKDYETIKIPKNMYIWATMNSADQGVFPMDTAFKRRWDFEYMDINKGVEDIEKWSFKVNDKEFNWNKLRKDVNDKLSELKINEDKLMGAHFLSKESVVDNVINNDTFKSKVLMYLYEDAAKMKRNEIFSEANIRYSKLCEDFDNGKEIFKGISMYNPTTATN